MLGCCIPRRARRTLCFLLFAAHAFGAVVGVWPLFGAAGFQTLIRYMEIVALYSLFMSVTTSEQPGTDFTILACAQLLVYLAGSLCWRARWSMCWAINGSSHGRRPFRPLP